MSGVPTIRLIAASLLSRNSLLLLEQLITMYYKTMGGSLINKLIMKVYILCRVSIANLDYRFISTW
jgi:hypothetical protein